MGRSVSTPSNATVVAYQHHETYYYCHTCDKQVEDEQCPNDFSDHVTNYDDDEKAWYCDECGDYVELEENGHGDLSHDVVYTSDWEDFDEFLDDVRMLCQEEWPSLYEIDEWIDREDHAILENGHVKVGVSEYCNTVAVWIVPHYDEWYPDHVPLHEHWAKQVEPKFLKTFGQLQSIGHMSNGVQVFKAKA